MHAAAGGKSHVLGWRSAGRDGQKGRAEGKEGDQPSVVSGNGARMLQLEDQTVLFLCRKKTVFKICHDLNAIRMSGLLMIL